MPVTILAGRQLNQTPQSRTATGTTDTITSADNGLVIYYTNASAVTVTVNNTVGVNFNCTIVQAGTGQVTINAGAGMTRRQRQSFTRTAGQYAIANLLCNASGEFIIQGDLA